MTPRVGVVLPAAGVGRRLGGRPKALLDLGGQPMLRRTLTPFLGDTRVRCVAVALGAGVLAAPPDWLTVPDARIRLVRGGERRGESVHAGLAALDPDTDIVLVHDAARPLVTPAVIDRTIAAAAEGRCVIAAVPAADTVQEVDEDRRIIGTPDRSRLWLAQTPQAFPYAILVAAYEQAARDGVAATDDAALVARYGAAVHVVEGDAANFKITVPADLALAEALLARS